MNRRSFLNRLAQTAGASMTYEAMAALGLVAVPAVRTHAFDLQGRGGGASVLVLGAGLAGLTAAYELGKRGYAVTVLEARQRPGGRCFTVRKGTTSEEDGASQTAAFDDGQFFNPGPMRIPHHHRTTLEYCKELGLPIEAFIDHNDSAYIYQTKSPTLKGRRLRAREVETDLTGYTAELLAKALSPAALNARFTKTDRDALMEYLRKAGGIDARGVYLGSPRRGYDAPPGAGLVPGTPSKPLPLHDLLMADVDGYVPIEYLHQPSMFQIVGGTDRLAVALAERVGSSKIVYGAAVQEIHQSADDIAIVYRRADGEYARVTAQFAVCTLPLPVVASLRVADLAPEVKAAAASVPYAPVGKIGLQFKRRFWEEDDGIFGGISRTDQDIAQIVYPSSNYLGQKGIVIGYYQTGAPATAMGLKSPVERQNAALLQGTSIHPQYAKEFESSFSVAWERVPWSRGGWAQWSTEARKTAYPTLLKPDRRLYFAGDHMTYLIGWMNGAFESAQQVAEAIHARALTTSPPPR